ncbi:hypothetical protein AB0J72_00715 [Dactylosporangium sp. NPDC049742]|uniref:hypothetical protein n=1 Tax=Dactylosporangium sp. NPDC049742 TaxID=3154737 RepID=UPI00342BEA80
MTTLNGRILGQAERATRAVLDRLLARSGTTFEQWVAVNLTAAGPLTRAELLAQMSAGLRTDPAAHVDAAFGAGLLTGDVALTDLGRSRYEEISAGIKALTVQIYGDLSPEDLDTAGRVLLQVTERANALV